MSKGILSGQRTPALFVGDSAGLDFLNSIATPVDTPVDWIGSGEGLLNWLEQAGLVPVDVLKAIQAEALPGELDKVADQARSLRDWFRGFVRKYKGHPLPSHGLDELEPLNRLLQRDEMYNKVALHDETNGPALELQLKRRWRSPESLLLPVGEALARLVCKEDFSFVKACEGPSCTLLFVDRTRGRARRWCSMAICGNRAKQAAHRHRLKAFPGDERTR